jgi:hypothetical protein
MAAHLVAHSRASPFAGFLFWSGVSAIAGAQLDPLIGLGFGQFFSDLHPLKAKRRGSPVFPC